MDTVEVRVARGAGWLDAVYPEWWTKIDLGALDLRDACRCVLGQIAGMAGDQRRTDDNGYGRVRTVALLAGVDENNDWADSHGFEAVFYPSMRWDYAALDEAWISEIKARWERGL